MWKAMKVVLIATMVTITITNIVINTTMVIITTNIMGERFLVF